MFQTINPEHLCITTLVDYYEVKEWPGIDQVTSSTQPEQIAECINQATKNEVNSLFSTQQSDRRFIPYIAIHEFEALLFSDSTAHAMQLKIDESTILNVLSQCLGPEAINNSPQSAPSKRLDGWSKNGKFPKTTTGITIAESIGIPKMRENCPLFNTWITELEAIVEGVT